MYLILFNREYMERERERDQRTPSPHDEPFFFYAKAHVSLTALFLFGGVDARVCKGNAPSARAQ